MLNKLAEFNIKLSAFGIFSIFILVLAQIILRQFNLYIPSLNEICGYLLISSFFLALAYSFEQGKHIRVSLLFELNNPQLSYIAELFAHTLALLMTLFINYACFQLMLDSYQHQEVSTGELAILEWPFQAMMLYASLIFTLSIAQKGWRLVNGTH